MARSRRPWGVSVSGASIRAWMWGGSMTLGRRIRLLGEGDAVEEVAIGGALALEVAVEAVDGGGTPRYRCRRHLSLAEAGESRCGRSHG